MRLWTLHPQYLDPRGLVALWREGLLAQQVLRGRTQGYRHHPQLQRFRAHPRPLPCVAAYLAAVHAESQRREYRFDAAKVDRRRRNVRLVETEGQLLYEWAHLKRKLRRRSPAAYRRVRGVVVPEPHPLFRIVAGEVRSWERGRPRDTIRRGRRLA
jgi:pyrimidine dimer DNA glycosylase